jgi:ribosomal protein S18 acetylase RimI-like enzyme
MSKRVARNVTWQLWHNALASVGPVVEVRQLQPGDIDEVVARIERRLRADAQVKDHVNPVISRRPLIDTLRSAAPATWTAHRGGRLVGHLFGARLESARTLGIWVGPDGVSFDDGDVLDALYARAATEWIADGAREHYVWVLDDVAAMGPWYELGFARVHVRGALTLSARSHALPDGYRLRRGDLKDLEFALVLDHELDRAEAEGPSFALGASASNQRVEWTETLSDPETRHYVVEANGRPVAQCVTFPLLDQRGSFDRTIHLSAVVVRREHRRLSVASAMVDAALNDALAHGFLFAETAWRATNHEAARYWTRYGFTTTYARLHRTIGRF